MTTEKNRKIITSTLGVILASASIMFVYTQNDKPTDDSKPVAIVDKETILEKHEQLNFPQEATLEIKEKEAEKKVAEANKVREEARDKAHAEKLAKEKAEREEAERQRQLALQKEKEKQRKHEQETKNYAVISRGENSQQVAQQAREYKQQQQQKIQSQGTNLGTFQVTGYGADCVGCSGITAAGINVRGGITHYQGYRVIATDPNVIPMFSIVHIEGVGNCIAVDTGGAIKGNIIDLLFPSEAHTHAWGRQNLNVSIIRYGA